MLKLLLLTLGIVAFALILLCVKLILVPHSTFGSAHIGSSKAMRERGISCAQSMDAMMRRENPHRVEERRNKHIKTQIA